MLAINQTFEELFGIENETKVQLHGRTDFAILTELFDANELCFSTHYQRFSERYHKNLERRLNITKGFVLPGVLNLLESLSDAPFRLGIITGNARAAANLKLQRFGLDHYFEFGGFGDDSANRDDVAAQAVEAAKSHLNGAFRLNDCWVIGDTPADVTCARSVGAQPIAVLTGGCDREVFDDYPVDHVLPDLTHLSPDHLLGCF